MRRCVCLVTSCSQWPVRKTYFQQSCDRRLRDGYAVTTQREVAVQNLFNALHSQAAGDGDGGHH